MNPAAPKAICTVASQSHIGQFLALVKSILRHEAALSVHLLVIDAAPEETPEITARAATFVGHAGLALTVLSFDEVYGEEADALRFRYDAFELCNVARGGLHYWLCERTTLECWVYLDGDMMCFGPLDGLFTPLDDHDIVLSAHRAQPGTNIGDDLILAMYGPYNGGMLGLRRGPVAQAFAAWFRERMRQHGHVDAHLPPELQPHQRFAFFADQTWLALVPTCFDKVLIQKARGLNFGPWCLRPGEGFETAPGGGPQVGHDAITLLHLSGWQAEQPHILSKHYPHDLSGNTWWHSFTAGYTDELARARAAFPQPYKYAHFADGTPISPYQRRAFMKLQMAGKQLDASPFQRRAAVENLAADFHTYDYASPGFQIVTPDAAFPNMVEGNRHRQNTPYLRKEVPHKWYVDIRQPVNGFISRDEALLLYNTARQFAGRPTLEIGAWMGWSACHLALGGVLLDVVDPLLADASVAASVTASLTTARAMSNCTLHVGSSPDTVAALAESTGRRWNLAFIDGNHFAPGPLEDARIVEAYAAEDALVLFHDLAFPDVVQGLAHFRARGWQTMVYLTMQLMGVAWRGKVAPLKHVPDPRVAWQLPAWLDGYRICR